VHELLKHLPLAEAFAGWGARVRRIEVAPWTINPAVMAITADDGKRSVNTRSARGPRSWGCTGFRRDVRVAPHAPDPAVRRRTQDYLQHVVRLCGTMGGSVLIFGSPSSAGSWRESRQRRPGDTRRRSLGAPSSWQALDQHRVTFCLEPLSANQTNFLSTTDEVIRFAREVATRAFGMMLDGYTLGWAGEDAAAAIGSRRRTSGTSTRRRDRQGPGSGDWTCADRGGVAGDRFRGLRLVEIHNYELDPDECASRCIRYLRRIFG